MESSEDGKTRFAGVLVYVCKCKCQCACQCKCKCKCKCVYACRTDIDHVKYADQVAGTQGMKAFVSLITPKDLAYFRLKSSKLLEMNPVARRVAFIRCHEFKLLENFFALCFSLGQVQLQQALVSLRVNAGIHLCCQSSACRLLSAYKLPRLWCHRPGTLQQESSYCTCCWAWLQGTSQHLGPSSAILHVIHPVCLVPISVQELAARFLVRCMWKPAVFTPSLLSSVGQ